MSSTQIFLFSIEPENKWWWGFFVSTELEVGVTPRCHGERTKKPLRSKHWGIEKDRGRVRRFIGYIANSSSKVGIPVMIIIGTDDIMFSPLDPSWSNVQTARKLDYPHSCLRFINRLVSWKISAQCHEDQPRKEEHSGLGRPQNSYHKNMWYLCYHCWVHMKMEKIKVCDAFAIWIHIIHVNLFI